MKANGGTCFRRGGCRGHLRGGDFSAEVLAGAGHGKSKGNSIIGARSGMYRGPEAEGAWVCSKSRKKAPEPGARCPRWAWRGRQAGVCPSGQGCGRRGQRPNRGYKMSTSTVPARRKTGGPREEVESRVLRPRLWARGDYFPFPFSSLC